MRFIIPSESRGFQLEYRLTGRGHDTGAPVDPDACGSCLEYVLAVSCAKPQIACFRTFMQSCRSRASGLLLPVRMRFPASAVSRRVRLPSSPASRANAAHEVCAFRASAPVPESYRREVSFLPLRAHLSGDRSITINPLSAVHFWYFSSISGRNREAFYQKYFYGISVLADILGIKPYFHKKNTRNHYQINSSW